MSKIAAIIQWVKDLALTKESASVELRRLRPFDDWQIEQFRYGGVKIYRNNVLQTHRSTLAEAMNRVRRYYKPLRTASDE